MPGIPEHSSLRPGILNLCGKPIGDRKFHGLSCQSLAGSESRMFSAACTMNSGWKKLLREVGCFFSEDSGTRGVVFAIARFAASGTMSALAAGLGVGAQIVVSVELTFKIAGREVALDKLAETLV